MSQQPEGDEMTEQRGGLTALVLGNQRRWILPFIMCVVGDIRVFEALAPVAGPGGTMPGGAHFYRTLMPFEKGYLDPGDGSYAEPLRRAHETAGIDPDVIGETLQWNITILSELARSLGFDEATTAELLARADSMSRDIRVAARYAVPNYDGLLEHFEDVTLVPGMREAFWEVVGFAAIQRITGALSDAEILDMCRVLPEDFVIQFARA